MVAERRMESEHRGSGAGAIVLEHGGVYVTVRRLMTATKSPSAGLTLCVF